MTLLDTVRKNRSDLPPVTGRQVMSTMFAYHKDATVASYCPKKGRVVILMSSLHSQGEVDVTNPKKKPAMILEYNATKGGVDTADKMLRTYSTKCMTRRWPVAVFSNVLDISALDAYIYVDTFESSVEYKTTTQETLVSVSTGEGTCWDSR